MKVACELVPVFVPCFASWLKKHVYYMSNALVSPYGLKNDEYFEILREELVVCNLYANLTTVGARERGSR